MRERILAFCVIFALFAFPLPLRAETLFPLKILSPSTPPAGMHRVRFGVKYNRGERLPFQERDRNRRVYYLPEVNVDFAIGSNVEVLVSYPFLYLKQDGQAWDYGSGDLKLEGVYYLANEGSLVPETALHMAVKLPTANWGKEFGTDETDFFAGGLFAKRWGNLTLLLNADFALLGNPRTENPAQDDVLFYKVGATYSFLTDARVGLEVEGVEFSRFGNDRLFVRGGISRAWWKIILDVGVAVGLTNASGDYQVQVGLSYPFGAERKPVSPSWR
jgi:hypothetical protein